METIVVGKRLPMEAWRIPAVLILISLVILLTLFWPTIANAAHLWNTSSAYNYAYLILPISAYLVWEKHKPLAALTPTPSAVGVVIVAAFAVAWLVADLLNINEGRHIAVLGMIQGVFLGFLGWTIYRFLAFPLLYLWLMVPTGEVLLPPLQRLATWGAVKLLQTTTIPVFTEGFVIQIPYGVFVVEPGCSGLNFVLASLALSLLFGYLTYTRWSSRLICIAVALTVSLLANIARIFLIVAITEWTHRKSDIADDHLLYGWGFFGLIMLAMMYFGMRFAPPIENPMAGPWGAPTDKRPDTIWFVAVTAAVIAVATAVRLYAAHTSNAPSDMSRLVLPEKFGAWSRLADRDPHWEPQFSLGDDTLQASYSDGGRTVDVAIVHYVAQNGDHEAANAGNHVWNGGEPSAISTTTKIVTIDHRDVTVGLLTFTTAVGPRIALQWYDSAGCMTASRLRAKICEARQRLLGQAAPGTYAALSTIVQSNPGDAADILAAFAAQLPYAAILGRTSAEDQR